MYSEYRTSLTYKYLFKTPISALSRFLGRFYSDDVPGRGIRLKYIVMTSGIKDNYVI